MELPSCCGAGVSPLVILIRVRARYRKSVRTRKGTPEEHPGRIIRMWRPDSRHHAGRHLIRSPAGCENADLGNRHGASALPEYGLDWRARRNLAGKMRMWRILAPRSHRLPASSPASGSSRSKLMPPRQADVTKPQTTGCSSAQQERFTTISEGRCDAHALSVSCPRRA